VFTKEEYLKITEIIQDYPNIVILEDVAYFQYYGDAHKPIPFATITSGNFEKTITFYSAGKMYNVTGIRVGIVVGPEKYVDEMHKIFTTELRLASVFDQMVMKENMISANDLNENNENYYESTRKDIIQRVKTVEKEFTALGMKMVNYEGTYYIILDIENWRGKIKKKYYQKLDDDDKTETRELDKAFCRMLFLEEKIGMIPLSCIYFGKDAPDNFVRVSINRSDEDLKFLIDGCKSLLTLNVEETPKKLVE